jgi:electron transport complex protein RnfB
MIAVPTLIMGGTGLMCGVVLAAATRILALSNDPKIEQAAEILPGANCGGCGYAGCADYAKAMVLNGASANLCLPGGADVVAALSSLLGVTAANADRKTAIVLCAGDSVKSPRRFRYNGVATCYAAAVIGGGGDKLCAYGCLGYGSCARSCPVSAIEITDRHLAVVHADLCIGCGACVKACPRSLIKLVPESRTIHVLCSSKDRGPTVKASRCCAAS